MGLNRYQEVIPIDDVPAEDLRGIVGLIVKQLGWKIVREQTPDYIGYELRHPADCNSQLR